MDICIRSGKNVETYVHSGEEVDTYVGEKLDAYVHCGEEVDKYIEFKRWTCIAVKGLSHVYIVVKKNWHGRTS